MNRIRGFALIEALIAVALIGIALLTMATFMGLRQKQETGVNYVTQESRELAQLATAVRAYAKDHAEDWTAGTAQVVTITDLQGAGLLPDDFARRNETGANEQGTSPFYQPYRIVAIKDATDGHVSSVVYETGAAARARLARVAVEPTPIAIEALKTRVAAGVQIDFKIPAGSIPAGSTTVEGSLGGFTKDLASYLGTAPTEAIAAVLVGFPDLEFTDEPPEIGDPPPGSKWSYCNFADPHLGRFGSGYEEASCTDLDPDMVEIQRVPFCGRINTDINPQYTVYPSDIGALTMTIRRENLGDFTFMDHWIETGGGFPNPTTYQLVTQQFSQWKDYSEVWINGAKVHQQGGNAACEEQTYQQMTKAGSRMHPPQPLPADTVAGCGSGTGTAPHRCNPANPSHNEEGYLWSKHYKNRIIVGDNINPGLHGNAWTLLCCKE